jgi:hypothetical protein
MVCRLLAPYGKNLDASFFQKSGRVPIIGTLFVVGDIQHHHDASSFIIMTDYYYILVDVDGKMQFLLLME